MKTLFLLVALLIVCVSARAQVVVSGTVTNNGGAFPVATANGVKGVHQIVADMTALSNSPSWLRDTGQTFHVLSDATDWRLIGGTNNGSLVQVPAATNLWTASGTNVYRASGKVGIGIEPDDTMTVAGAIHMVGLSDFDAGLLGRIYRSDGTGLTIVGVTATISDLALASVTGEVLVENPTGTADLELVRGGGKVGIGTVPVFKLDLVGTSGLADRTIAINGLPVVYLPEGALSDGSMAFGNGLRNVVHVSGNDGYYNFAAGRDAVLENTTGRGNVGVGPYVLKLNTVGYANTGVGANVLQSLNALTDNFGNSGFGFQALANLTNGVENTAGGNQAMVGTYAGNHNSAWGEKSLDGNKGDRNSGFGHRSGYLQWNGADNLFLGVFSGDGGAGNEWHGSRNVVAGNFALVNANTGTSNNVIMGYGSASNLLTGTGNILIGYQVDLSDSASSNTLNVGNVIFATGLGAIGTNTSTAFVGIGTNSPRTKLHVVSTNRDDIVFISGATNGIQIGASDSYGLVAASDGGTNYSRLALSGSALTINPYGVTKVIVAENGFVGINTTDPTDRLHVVGAVQITSNTDFDAAKPGRIYKGEASGLVLHTVTGNTYDFGLYTPGGSPLIENKTGTTDILLARGGGNVGIGTPTPAAKLDVGGDILTAGNLLFEGATADGFETALTVTDPTADRTVTFQNASGTVAYLSDISAGGGTNRYYEAGEAFHWVEVGGTNGDPYGIKGASSSATVSSWSIDYGGNVATDGNITAAGSLNITSGAQLGSTLNVADTVTVGAGVNGDGGGLKHGRVTTGSISGLASAAVTLTWSTPFANANYTVTCDVVEADATVTTLRKHHIESQTASAVVVRVINDHTTDAKTGILHVMAIHD